MIGLTREVVVAVIPWSAHNRVPAKPLLRAAGIVTAVFLPLIALPVVSVAAAPPAQPPAAGPSTVGITVTGIAGGSVRVAVLEVGGRSFIVGVGDRVRDFTVKAISQNEVVLGYHTRTYRLPLSRAPTPQTAIGGAPPTGAVPAAAAPTAAPAPPVSVTPPPSAGTPIVYSPPAGERPAAASPSPPPATAAVTSVNLAAAGYPQPTAVPVWGVPLTPSPPNPQAIPPGAGPYTPAGTSAFGFGSAPITPQSTVTRDGITALPVASSQQQQDPRVIPAGTTLYTPSGTSVYGVTSAPITPQSEVTLRGVTVLPVASNQTPPASPALPWPTYRVEVGPFSDQRGATAIAESLAKTGFRATVEATPGGQYVVTLNPPPQSTVERGLAVIKSVGPDLPIKIELTP